MIRTLAQFYAVSLQRYPLGRVPEPRTLRLVLTHLTNISEQD